MRTGILILMIALLLCLIESCDQATQAVNEDVLQPAVTERTIDAQIQQEGNLPETAKVEFKTVCVKRSFRFAVAAGD